MRSSFPTGRFSFSTHFQCSFPGTPCSTFTASNMHTWLQPFLLLTWRPISSACMSILWPCVVKCIDNDNSVIKRFTFCIFSFLNGLDLLFTGNIAERKYKRPTHDHQLEAAHKNVLVFRNKSHCICFWGHCPPERHIWICVSALVPLSNGRQCFSKPLQNCHVTIFFFLKT